VLETALKYKYITAKNKHVRRMFEETESSD